MIPAETIDTSRAALAGASSRAALAGASSRAALAGASSRAALAGDRRRSTHSSVRASLLLAGAAVAASIISAAVRAENMPGSATPRADLWLVKSAAQIEIPAIPINARKDREALTALVARRTPDDLARYR